MRRIDSPDTVVGVVGSAHAEAERSSCPEGSGAPMLVVVAVAVHTLGFTEFLEFCLQLF